MQGTADKLIEQLKEADETGDMYIQDFLLTYRTFVSSTSDITSRLLEWFGDRECIDKVCYPPT